MGSKASGTGPYLLLGSTDRPEKGKMLKLISLKFEHLDKTKDLTAKLEHLDKTKDLAAKGEGRHAHHKPAQEELFAKGGIPTLT
jgi:hypothetical protein